MLGKLFSKKPKSVKKIHLEGTDIVFPAAKGQTILEAAEEAGLAFPYNCRVGSCTECKCVVKGEVKELADSNFVLKPEEIAAGMKLACQSIPRSDLTVKVTLREASGPAHKKLDGVISKIEDLTHDIKAVSVKLDSAISYIPGQYAQLLESSIGEPRSYSMAAASKSGKTDTLLFYIRHVPGGAFTGWLFEKDRTGAKLEVRAPFGMFYLREADDSVPIIFIAGGSGLAPVKAILEGALGTKRPVQFFFGARTQRDLYALDEIGKLASEWKGSFEFIPALSEEPEDSDWKGERGLITEVLDRKTSDLSQSQSYLCGPPPMIDAAVEVLKKHNIPEENIFMDKFLDKSH